MSGEMVVIDASIAVKWVVEEDGTSELLVAECSDSLWTEALLSARVISLAETASGQQPPNADSC